MSFSRRELLRFLSSAGVVGVFVPQLACSTDEGTEGLPSYKYDGPMGPDTTFETGIASGDPAPDSVILWTALHPGDLGGGTLELFVEVAHDPAFEDRIAAGYHETNPDRGYTFKVEVTGLEPDTTYYYRWHALGRTSRIGRTRTTPVAARPIRLAVVSCSSLGWGYFHSYGAIARRADLDLVLHLGDYIYEYGDGEVGGGGLRAWDPPHEVVTLDDYRRRYAQYRRDPDLQEAHRQHPWTTTWDDHEFANDLEPGGAENHDPDQGEGEWSDRVAAALQAYDEWMPTRQGRDGDIYRVIDMGAMARVLVVDINQPLLFPGPGDDAPGAQTLGAKQAQWLDERFAEMASADTAPKYVVLAQARTFAPRGSEQGNAQTHWHDESRARVLNAFAASSASEMVVVAGDIHQGQAADVPRDVDTTYDPTTGEGSEAVEFVCMALTSPGGQSDVDAIPNLFWSNGLDKGYLVLDLDTDRFHADFFGTSFLEDELGSPAKPKIEHVHATFGGTPGQHHVETTSAPVPTKTDAPPLAP